MWRVAKCTAACQKANHHEENNPESKHLCLDCQLHEHMKTLCASPPRLLFQGTVVGELWAHRKEYWNAQCYTRTAEEMALMEVTPAVVGRGTGVAATSVTDPQPAPSSGRPQRLWRRHS